MTDTAYDYSAISEEDFPGVDFLSPEEPNEFLEQSEPTPSDLDDSEPTEPDAATITKQRPRGAITYQKKARSILREVFDMTCTNSATVADSAALLLYADNLSEKAGDLAATDKNAARVIDFLSGDVTENYYLALGLAATPLILQVIRNHEPTLEPVPRGFRIPFVKDKNGQPRRFRIKFGIKLGRLRPITKDPQAITEYVYSNPKIQAQLAKRKIRVAKYPSKRRRSASNDD